MAQLLRRHLPRLRYDSRERFYASSVSAWADNPVAREHANGVLPRPPVPGDTPADRDTQPRPADSHPSSHVYGHAAQGGDGRLWLAYWFFYLYNDYTLLGPLFGAGRHEGDWEMIQLRLDQTGEVPDLALYGQHQDVEARSWQLVERVGDQPVVYVARGCHACYYGPGRYWTGAWFDRADGRGPAPDSQLERITDGDSSSEWVHWPGRWGGTRPGRGIGRVLGFDASSPRGPGHQRQWQDPARLLDWVKSRRPLRLPVVR